jgi:hypothetical protein
MEECPSGKLEITKRSPNIDPFDIDISYIFSRNITSLNHPDFDIADRGATAFLG